MQACLWAWQPISLSHGQPESQPASLFQMLQCRRCFPSIPSLQKILSELCFFFLTCKHLYLPCIAPFTYKSFPLRAATPKGRSLYREREFSICVCVCIHPLSKAGRGRCRGAFNKRFICTCVRWSKFPLCVTNSPIILRRTNTTFILPLFDSLWVILSALLCCTNLFSFLPVQCNEREAMPGRRMLPRCTMSQSSGQTWPPARGR